MICFYHSFPLLLIFKRIVRLFLALPFIPLVDILLSFSINLFRNNITSFGILYFDQKQLHECEISVNVRVSLNRSDNVNFCGVLVSSFQHGFSHENVNEHRSHKYATSLMQIRIFCLMFYESSFQSMLFQRRFFIKFFKKIKHTYDKQA